MKELHQQMTLKDAALKAGVDPKTARKYRKSKGLIEKQPRIYLTRPNPFGTHWAEIESMLEEAPELQAPTILNYLIEKYPGQYNEGQRRSLFRRLKMWRAEHCDNNKIIFRQELKPGRQSQSDWTDMNELRVKINSNAVCKFFRRLKSFQFAKVCVG